MKKQSGKYIKLNPIAFASTFALIDIILHPLFHLWVSKSSETYEWAMNIFVAGLQLNVTSFDTSIGHILLGTILEAFIFWIFGFAVASIYNFFDSRSS